MRNQLHIALVILFLLVAPVVAMAQKPYVAFKKESASFAIATAGKTAPVFISKTEFGGVLRAANNLKQDLNAVTGAAAEVIVDDVVRGKEVIVVGTLGSNPFIDGLVKNGKLNVSEIKGKWEGFKITLIDKPQQGIDRAMLIIGSDKRGSIFGIYDLAQSIGVSPWSWWADVPVKKHSELFFINSPIVKIPGVKYRGIFINDEQPALGGWVKETYGGFNSKFYEKVFDLILRLKGNFLWPAMWGQSFFSDDSLSPKLADEFGVVISTSHHEPMMRAHVEWQRNGGGPWNYNTNEEKLRQFWKEGITRMGKHESIVTLAMRGDGDEPMSEDANVKLLQKIVADQRRIIEEVTEKPAADVPQVWALYKEVQDYYDKGMRVPDDVTLLLCDDNWGNIRKLPSMTEKPHPGGYGIYYHFDYVGDPRNYKWINTNPLPRIWEQMNLAWQYGAREIWVVNVGDIKPMEFPIEFFLDYAFDPTIRENELDAYTQRWAAREFGDEHAPQIATLLSKYAKFNSRRKPELLGPDTFSPELYSLVNYREAEMVVKDYNVLAEQARAISDKLPKEYKDAFYQLVLYPVQACANLNEMYYNVRLNRLYAAQGRVRTKALADRAKSLFERDAELARYYNETMANGKWKHMMDQLRIGYVGWHDTFKENTLPRVDSITPVKGPSLGVWAEGSESYFPGTKEGLKLPVLSSAGSNQRMIEIFNRGTAPLEVTVEPSASFVKVNLSKLTIVDEKRIAVLIDWKNAPKGRSSEWITIKRESESVKVEVPIENISGVNDVSGFVESDGYIAMDAEHFSKVVGEGDVQWKTLPDHGRTAGAVASYPGNAAPSKIHAASPHVEYEVYFTSSGKFKVHSYFSPTIDFTAGDGLNFAVSIDDAEPVMLNVHSANTHRDWQESVKNNIRVVVSEHEVKAPGRHTVKFWRVDPGVVLQKIVIDTGGLRASYLGPPESVRVRK